MNVPTRFLFTRSHFNHSYYTFSRICRRTYSTQSKEPTTFEATGVDEFVLRALKDAFPHIKEPTPVQREFIPAILGGKDVLLQDKTGTGKSLGLLLALLSKQRAARYELPKYWKKRAAKSLEAKEAITAIVIVPHNDLAHQFANWVKSMHLSPSSTVLRTLLKDPEISLDDQLARIAKVPPHILVTTPNALQACWKTAKKTLTLDSVSTVVLDEADHLLRVPSNNTPLSVQRRWRKHPPVVRDMLTEIFKLRPKSNDQALAQPSQTSPPPSPPIQLVLVSATLRPAVRKFLYLETKWLSQKPGQTVTIESTKAMDPRNDPVRHYGLFVDVSGRVRNIMDPEAAYDMNREEAMASDLEDVLPHSEISEEGQDAETSTALSSVPESLLWGRNRLPPQLLDAIVSIFVFDVPQFALLVIPSEASAKGTVEDLAELGVKAVNLDEFIQSPRKTMHELGVRTKRPNFSLPITEGDEENKNAEEEAMDDPVMLVAVQSAVRGIDLPLLSHVFIAGVPESEVDYIHLSGRVGRMGAPANPKQDVKKVITFLAEPNLSAGRNASKIMQKERRPQRELERIWKMTGVRPSIYARAL